MAEFSDLLGKTLVSVVNDKNQQLTFTTAEGEIFVAYHSQDCCENVEIEDIEGNLEDLIGTPILMAEIETNSKLDFGKEIEDDSFTWTFYRLATNKGYVTVRWLGTSNGYYSEEVSFYKQN